MQLGEDGDGPVATENSALPTASSSTSAPSELDATADTTAAPALAATTAAAPGVEGSDSSSDGGGGADFTVLQVVLPSISFVLGVLGCVGCTLYKYRNEKKRDSKVEAKVEAGIQKATDDIKYAKERETERASKPNFGMRAVSGYRWRVHMYAPWECTCRQANAIELAAPHS